MRFEGIKCKAPPVRYEFWSKAPPVHTHNQFRLYRWRRIIIIIIIRRHLYALIIFDNYTAPPVHLKQIFEYNSISFIDSDVSSKLNLFAPVILIQHHCIHKLRGHKEDVICNLWKSATCTISKRSKKIVIFFLRIFPEKLYIHTLVTGNHV